MKTLRFAIIASMFAASAWAGDVTATWKSKCSSCHGEDGKAQTKTGKKEKVSDMTNPDWQANWTDEKLKEVILNGSKDNNKMKAFKGKLQEPEIDALIKHIREFKP